MHRSHLGEGLSAISHPLGWRDKENATKLETGQEIKKEATEEPSPQLTGMHAARGKAAYCTCIELHVILRVWTCHCA